MRTSLRSSRSFRGFGPSVISCFSDPTAILGRSLANLEPLTWSQARKGPHERTQDCIDYRRWAGAPLCRQQIERGTRPDRHCCRSRKIEQHLRENSQILPPIYRHSALLSCLSGCFEKGVAC